MSGLLPLYRSPSGTLVEAGRVQGRQATRLNVSSAPVGPPPVGDPEDNPKVATSHHLVPVEIGPEALKAAPGHVLVLEPEGPRVVSEFEFRAAYSLVTAVNLHDRANAGGNTG